MYLQKVISKKKTFIVFHHPESVEYAYNLLNGWTDHSAPEQDHGPGNELATLHDGKRTAALTNHARVAGGLLAPPPARLDAHDGRLEQIFAPTGTDDDEDGRSSSGHDDEPSRRSSWHDDDDSLQWI